MTAAPPSGGDARVPAPASERGSDRLADPSGDKRVATHLHEQHSGKAPFHQQVESNESERTKVVEPSAASSSAVSVCGVGVGKGGGGGGVEGGRGGLCQHMMCAL